MYDRFTQRDLPWARMMACGRLAELHMNFGQGPEALRYLREALSTADRLGDWPDVMGVRWGMTLASLQAGVPDEAERWLELTGDLLTDLAAYRSFALAVRGELLLVRGAVDTGLDHWRRAVDVMMGSRLAELPVEPGLEVWSLELRAVAVVAHARHGRPELVAGTVDELATALRALLGTDDRYQPSYLAGLPLCGALLLALGTTDLARGRPAGPAVRMIALAERLRYLRQFQPTMSAASARETAERADRTAYDDAVSSYADLGLDELRAAGSALLRETGRG